jgi:hypothetical protein
MSGYNSVPFWYGMQEKMAKLDLAEVRNLMLAQLGRLEEIKEIPEVGS